MSGDTVVSYVIATRGRLDPLGHQAIGLGPLGGGAAVTGRFR
jgi:hypothetical protein